MDLDDEHKAAGRASAEDEGKRKAPAEDDLLADVEFDLLDEPDGTEETEEEAEEEEDVFARDTAIPASPPEQLAAEAMRRADAGETHDQRRGRDLPRMPPPPPRRPQRLTPITMEPPSEDLEFDTFDAPIDVFGNQLPGTERDFVGRAPEITTASEVPTAPPVQAQRAVEQGKITDPAAQRANRAAFLAETTRNRPIDPEYLQQNAPSSPRAGRAARDGRAQNDSALEFLDGLDSLHQPRSPMAGLAAHVPQPSPRAASVKEIEECYAVGDYTRALQIAEDLLARSPDDLAARRYVQNCRDVLTQMFAARIGPLDQVISVMVSPEEVQWLSLDHRAGFLLSLVDGQSTVDEILDISGMTRLDALKIILDLTTQQVVRLA